jgi:transposase
MKQTYYLGLDVAKEKIRAALCEGSGAICWEADLAVSASGRSELLEQLKARTGVDPGQVLVLVEATGLLHLNWAAALTRAGYRVGAINPLIARRLYRVENALRDSKTDRIDARGLCQIAGEKGEALLRLYGFRLRAAQLSLQRLQSVRHALRRSLTNLKKTYRSLLDLSFPELEGLLEIDGVGIRQLLSQAPTPGAIARQRVTTLQSNWMLRPKARKLKALAAESIADPELAEANAPALQALLAALGESEARLRAVDRAIAQLSAQALDPQQRQLLETIPGFGPIIAAQTLSWLPAEILQSGSRRAAAARLQAFMGNDPRRKQSGQYIGQTRMSKRGVALLRTAFFQAAFSASQRDPELRSYYLRKRAQGHEHKVALSHLMRILTRRLVAVLRSGQPYQPHGSLKLQNAA